MKLSGILPAGIPLFLGMLIVVTLARVHGRDAARAASFRQDGDRIEVDALDQRMVFLKKDAAKLFVNTPAQCRDQTASVRLDQWNDNRNLADCLRENIPDHSLGHAKYLLSISGFPRVDHGLIFPGGVKSDADDERALGTEDLEIRIGEAITNDCGGKDGEWKPTARGYEVRRIGADPAQEYRLPASERLGNATRDLCVVCGGFSCFVNLISSDKQVSLTFAWAADRPDGANPDFSSSPKASWKEYDRVVRMIADSIFAHRPQGYLQ